MITHKGFFYPDSDTKLKLVHDWVDDIDMILKHVDQKRICVQAGGAVGVWPSKLAGHFERVYTFEPVPENYDCLVRNVPDNVRHAQVGLSDQVGMCSLNRDEFEDTNSGAWYLKENGNTPVISIDTIPLDCCDLIQLDVEGFELKVLIGAIETIKRFKPVIVIEEKPLPQQKKPEAARAYLEYFGYNVVDSIHRDIILKC